MTSIVALSKSDTHYEGVQDSLRLLEHDIKQALSGIDHIILKINLDLVDPFHKVIYFEGKLCFQIIMK